MLTIERNDITKPLQIDERKNLLKSRVDFDFEGYVVQTNGDVIWDSFAIRLAQPAPEIYRQVRIVVEIPPGPEFSANLSGLPPQNASEIAALRLNMRDLESRPDGALYDCFDTGPEPYQVIVVFQESSFEKMKEFAERAVAYLSSPKERGTDLRNVARTIISEAGEANIEVLSAKERPLSDYPPKEWRDLNY
jgi:hypothetical protein